MKASELDSWYRSYGPMVLRRARSIVGDEQTAKDMLQEVFMRVMRAENDFRRESSPVTWLYRITTNLCLNWLRDRGRRAELLAERVAPAMESSAPTAEAGLDVARLLARVPEQLREIAVYYYVDEMNQDEIAALLGVSRRTIGNRLEEFRTAALGNAAAPPAVETAS